MYSCVRLLVGLVSAVSLGLGGFCRVRVIRRVAVFMLGCFCWVRLGGFCSIGRVFSARFVFCRIRLGYFCRLRLGGFFSRKIGGLS